MSNVLDDLTRSISTDVAKQVGGSLGEAPDKAQKSVGIAAASVLAGLSHRFADAGGGERLAVLLKDKFNDRSALSNVTSLYGALMPGSARPAYGGHVVEAIFAGKREDVAKEIAAAGGISGAAANKLLEPVARHVMALLGRDLEGAGGISGAGLGRLLDAQKGTFGSRLPSGLGWLTSHGSKVSSGASVSSVAAAAVSHKGHTHGTQILGGHTHGKRVAGIASSSLGLFGLPPWLRWALPLLLLLIGGLWWLAGGNQREARAPAPAQVQVTAAPKVEARVEAKVEKAAEEARAAVIPGVTSYYEPGKPFTAETYYNPEYTAAVAAAAEEPVVAAVPGVTSYYEPGQAFTAETYYNPDYTAPIAVAAAEEPAAAAVPGVTSYYEPGQAFTAETYYNPDYTAPAPVAVAAAEEPAAAPVAGVTSYYEPGQAFTAETYYNPDYTAPVAVAAAEPVAAAVPGVTSYYEPGQPFTGETYYNPDYQATGAAPASAVADCQSAVTAAVKAGDIRFRTASAKIADESRAALDRLVEAVKACPGVKLRIEGHTDSDGSNERNQALSENRANAVAEYLSEAGIDSKRLEAVGFGEDKPIATNDTPEGKAQNRRIELIVEKL